MNQNTKLTKYNRTVDLKLNLRSIWKVWHTDLLGLLGVIFVVLLFGHRLIGPTTTVPGDVLSAYPPWSRLLPQAMHNSLISDPVVQLYPYRKYINDTLQRGDLPLWNPYILTGQSVAADPNINLFYPTTIGLGWLSAANAFDIQILIHLFVAALGMYVLIRVWNGSPVGGVTAAAAFCGCSALTVWQQYPNLFTTGAWLPWLLACFELAQHRRRWLWIGAGGLVLGLIFLANFLQWALYGLFLLGCYAIYLAALALWNKDWRRGLRPVFDLIIIVALGVGIGAVQLLPLFELASLASRSQPLTPALIRGGALDPVKLLTAFAPNYFGTPVVSESNWGPPMNYAESTLFWGFYPFLLAISAPLWRRDRPTLFLWLMLLFAGSLTISTPAVYLLAFVPGFNVFAPVRMIYLLCFCGAALTGLVLNAVGARPNRWRALLVIGGLAILARGILHVVLLQNFEDLPRVTTPLSQDLQWTTLIVAAGIGVLGLSALVTKYMSLIRLVGLSFLIVVDVVRFSLPYNSATIAEQDLYPMPELLATIPASIPPTRLGVIHSGKEVLVPNSLLALGIAQVGGYSSLIPEQYKQFINQLDPQFETSFYIVNPNRLFINSYTTPLADLLGMEYVVSREKLPAPLSFVLSGESLYLYRNTQPPPRAYIVPNTKAVSTFPDALNQLKSEDYTVCNYAVVIAEQLPVAGAGNLNGCVGDVQFKQYTANGVQIAATTPVAGLLVLSDQYYPGWKAIVDGVEQPIYQANGVFRGVWLEAGQHQVDFVFRPPRVILGAIISLVAILASLSLVFIGRRQGRRGT